MKKVILSLISLFIGIVILGNVVKYTDLMTGKTTYSLVDNYLDYGNSVLSIDIQFTVSVPSDSDEILLSVVNTTDKITIESNSLILQGSHFNKEYKLYDFNIIRLDCCEGTETRDFLIPGSELIAWITSENPAITILGKKINLSAKISDEVVFNIKDFYYNYVE